MSTRTLPMPLINQTIGEYSLRTGGYTDLSTVHGHFDALDECSGFFDTLNHSIPIITAHGLAVTRHNTVRDVITVAAKPSCN